MILSIVTLFTLSITDYSKEIALDDFIPVFNKQRGKNQAEPFNPEKISGTNTESIAKQNKSIVNS